MTDPEFAARPQLEDIARYVCRRIFQGAYSAGEYLRLDQLATQLGISVTPVREALLNLRAEGLLVQQPRRAWRRRRSPDATLRMCPTSRPSSGRVTRARRRTSARNSWRSCARFRPSWKTRTPERITNAWCASITNFTGPSMSPRNRRSDSIHVRHNALRTGIGVSHGRGLARAIDQGSSAHRGGDREA